MLIIIFISHFNVDNNLDIDNACFNSVQQHIASRIIGQKSLINSMLIGLLCDGHLLIEGLPGLAKTTAVKALSEAIEADFHRIQFTPDLLPSDLVGTEIYCQSSGDFEFRSGPIFHNILLADEINRAPAKVQSALLEAMAENQVTVGKETYPLPPLFMVLATQNPVEQEGTYQLPEAQLDRFLMHVWVEYPNHEEELAILDLDSQEHQKASTPCLSPLDQATIFKAKAAVNKVYIDQKLKQYIVSLVIATRNPENYDNDLKRWSRFGASPRASIALLRCSKAIAWLQGDAFVTPEHIHAVAKEVLRHRILLTFEAEADGITTDVFIEKLLAVVAIP
ncbi:MAG: MoxR family ATPase [Methylococcales bacterium]|nr:MoxR family ATPase [Methylococcales bacterium]